MPALAVFVLLTAFSEPQSSSAPPSCANAQACREMALAARERGEVETFHDLAWRAVQSGPRDDAALMFLLARAQSVSGRAHDALVMLKRLAARDFDISDADTSEDFRRVRNLAAWAEWKGVAGAVETPPSPPPAPPPTAAPSAKPLAPAAPARARESAASANAAAAPAAIEVERDDPLPFPDGVQAPSAMAYDGVSGRLVLVDESTDTLKVLSEVSGNAANLVSRGWGGSYRTTGIAIDPARGDLWATGAANGSDAEAPSVVHRLQLVSGRLLYSVPAPTTRPDAQLVAIALAGNTVYALDAVGHRIFELAPGTKTLRRRATIKVDSPSSLAVSADGWAFVSHPDGVLRVSLADGKSAPLTAAKGVDLDDLRWITRRGSGLLGIQRRADGTHAAVRIRLDAAGRRATRLDVLGDAVSPAATVMGNVFYYLAPSGSGGTVVQRVKLR